MRNCSELVTRNYNGNTFFLEVKWQRKSDAYRVTILHTELICFTWWVHVIIGRRRTISIIKPYKIIIFNCSAHRSLLVDLPYRHKTGRNIRCFAVLSLPPSSGTDIMRKLYEIYNIKLKKSRTKLQTYFDNPNMPQIEATFTVAVAKWMTD
jgi:hypothetical protein